MILERRKRERLRMSASTDPTVNLLDGERTTYGAIAGADAAEVSNNPGQPDSFADEELPSMRELLVPRLLIPLLNYGFFCFSQTAFQGSQRHLFSAPVDENRSSVSVNVLDQHRERRTRI